MLFASLLAVNIQLHRNDNEVGSSIHLALKINTLLLPLCYCLGKVLEVLIKDDSVPTNLDIGPPSGSGKTKSLPY